MKYTVMFPCGKGYKTSTRSVTADTIEEACRIAVNKMLGSDSNFLDTLEVCQSGLLRKIGVVIDDEAGARVFRELEIRPSVTVRADPTSKYYAYQVKPDGELYMDYVYHSNWSDKLVAECVAPALGADVSKQPITVVAPDGKSTEVNVEVRYRAV